MNLNMHAYLCTLYFVGVHFVAPVLYNHDWDILSMNMLDDGLNSGAFPCMKRNPDDYTVPTSTTDSRGGYEQLVSVLSTRSYFL